MGIDPNKLGYFYNGLNQKLVGVEPVEPIHIRLSREIRFTKPAEFRV